jgi:predicted esterase
MPINWLSPATLTNAHRRGRIQLPKNPAAVALAKEGAAVTPGRDTVQIAGQTVGVIRTPTTAVRQLVVMLHGAGGRADSALQLLSPVADEHGMLLFAPQSVGRTWDVISMGAYGADVARIERVVEGLLAAHAATAAAAAETTAGEQRAPLPLRVGGFSDGASYALSLALSNGDVFDAALAFSPGFSAALERVGRPACFLSHGRADRVLPIDRCSRRLVPMLRSYGLPVHYVEFDGGHDVPASAVDDAMEWLSRLES